jgi:hypothetical protein
MMNMMNRFVEGRGHLREIDMLLELTCVCSSCDVPNHLVAHLTLCVSTANKSKAAPSAPSATRQRGPFRVSCGISVRRWRSASQNSARAKAAYFSAGVSPATLTPRLPYLMTSAASCRRLGHRQRRRQHDIGGSHQPYNSNLMSLTLFAHRTKSQYISLYLVVNRTCVRDYCTPPEPAGCYSPRAVSVPEQAKRAFATNLGPNISPPFFWPSPGPW